MASQQCLYRYKRERRPRPGSSCDDSPRGCPDVVHQSFLLGQGDQRGAQEGPACPDVGLAQCQAHPSGDRPRVDGAAGPSSKAVDPILIPPEYVSPIPPNMFSQCEGCSATYSGI